ncbi:MAG: hypothetical protein QW273_03625, partial [Candidatus Pacearchaeota archaeon]
MKKGSTHIDFILAFSIFVSALVFILIFINPSKNPKEDYLSMQEILKSSFFNLTSSDAFVLFLNVSGSDSPCIPPSIDEILNGRNISTKKISSYKYYLVISAGVKNETLTKCIPGNFSTGSLRKEVVLLNESLKK